MKKQLSVVLAALMFVSAGVSRTEAQDGIRPLRIEAQGVYHFGPAVAAEFAFATGPSSAVGLSLGGSYGVRDAWNSVAVGVNYYPFSEEAKGFFVNLGAAYGFDVSSVQGNSGTDWRASVLVGYRVVFGFLTGSLAAGINDDIVQNGPAGAVVGISPAVLLSVGIALDSPR